MEFRTRKDGTHHPITPASGMSIEAFSRLQSADEARKARLLTQADDSRKSYVNSRRKNILETMAQAKALGYDVKEVSKFILKKGDWHKSSDGERYALEHRYFWPSVTTSSREIHEPQISVKAEVTFVRSQYGGGVEPRIEYNVRSAGRWFSPAIGEFRPHYNSKTYDSGDVRLDAAISFAEAKAGIPKLKRFLEKKVNEAAKENFNNKGLIRIEQDREDKVKFARWNATSEELKNLLEKVYNKPAVNIWAQAIERSREKGQDI